LEEQMNLTSDKISVLVSESLKQGRKYFPRPLANIQDREDQESDFLYGVALGLVKARRRSFRLRSRSLVQYLVNNGIWTLRRKRFRSMRRKFVYFCQCGKQLGFNQKPCHGTMRDRVIEPFVVTVDPDWLGGEGPGVLYTSSGPVRFKGVVDIRQEDEHAYQGA
jgi:hypothetical protein